MGRLEKFYEHIPMPKSDTNVSFETLCILLRRLGFDEFIRGDHHIFAMDNVEEITNLQPKDGKGKPYQVKQVRNMILEYRLRVGE